MTLDTDLQPSAETVESGDLGHMWDDVGTIPRMLESSVFYYGDNLGVMRDLPSDSVDLIYLDPPFNSQRTYNTFFKERDDTPSEAQRRAFDDYWRWGPEAQKAYDAIAFPRDRRLVSSKLSDTVAMLHSILGGDDMLAYLAMMTIRLVEMRRVLKPTGSLYLHCDPTASHYLKLLLDSIFGPDRFMSEIVWKRTGAHGSSHRWAPVHDVILCYYKSDAYTWTDPRGAPDPEYVAKKFTECDPGSSRMYQGITLTGSGIRHGESGKPWRGIDPTAGGRHWALPGAVVESIGIQTQGVHAKLDALDAAGLIKWPDKADGRPRLKWYADQLKGTAPPDVWTDIAPLNSQASERLGYPTQKPLALLERIILASSREGDVVLDPFCGCGTTVEAAQKHGRRWIGIDITHIAVSVLRRRMGGRFTDVAFKVYGEPQDLASARTLARDNRWEFQAWIVDKVGGLPTDPPKDKRVAKGGGDKGIDGWLLFRDDPKAARSKRIVLSVKSDQKPMPEMVRELMGTMQFTGAIAGALLLLEQPTQGMLAVANSAGRYASELFSPDERFDRIQILSVADIFDGKKLMFPGWNSSHRSVPPAGTMDASGDLFEWAAGKKPAIKKAGARAETDEPMRATRGGKRR